MERLQELLAYALTFMSTKANEAVTAVQTLAEAWGFQAAAPAPAPAVPLPSRRTLKGKLAELTVEADGFYAQNGGEAPKTPPRTTRSGASY